MRVRVRVRVRDPNPNPKPNSNPTLTLTLTLTLPLPLTSDRSESRWRVWLSVKGTSVCPLVKKRHSCHRSLLCSRVRKRVRHTSCSAAPSYLVKG